MASVVTLDDLTGRRRDEVLGVARAHGATSIAVFGSVARGDEAPDSDVDFLVDFEPGRSLLDLVRLIDELEALLGCPVDVVAAGGLKARDAHIRREAVAL